jgi:hypothetical protein
MSLSSEPLCMFHAFSAFRSSTPVRTKEYTRFPLCVARVMSYVVSFIPSRSKIRVVTKSVKGMPDSVVTTCDATMYEMLLY